MKTEKKYGTISFEKNAYEYVIAWPAEFGIDTEDDLFHWENKDSANRMVIIAEDEAEAYEVKKTHLNN